MVACLGVQPKEKYLGVAIIEHCFYPKEKDRVGHGGARGHTTFNSSRDRAEQKIV